MKLKNIIVLVLIVAILLGIKVFFFPSKNAAANSKSSATSKNAPTVITAFVVKSSTMENIINASGTILANEEVELRPEIAGKIVQLNLKEGSNVSKGQLIVKINDADFQSQLKKLKLESLLAEKQLNRELELLKINGISQQQVDISENKFNSLKADIEFIQSQIAKTEIRAPFSGIVGLKSISEGAYVTPNTIVANLIQTNPVKLDFSVSERYSDLIKKGDKVTFKIEGLKSEFLGQVFAIEPKIDLATRTLKVRAICSNAKGVIFPGSFAQVQLILNQIDNTILIPTESIIPDLRGKKVVVVKDGKANFVTVKTGLRTETSVQITEGLQVGDTIVTTGLMQLKPSSPVKISATK